MTVEITPSGNASELARQLLTVAENDPRFRIDDVKTTTSGPMGLAFLVPQALFDAWQDAFPPVGAGNDAVEQPLPPRRGRRPRNSDTDKED